MPPGAPARASRIVTRPGLVALGGLVAFGLAGCGMGAFDGDRGEPALPTLAAGPYGKPVDDLETPAKEPYVLARPGANLSEPSALAREGGGYRLWFGYAASGAAESEIWGAELDEVFGATPIEPFPVLEATEPWEQGSVGAPSVVALSDSELVMFYQGGIDTPAIGRADSFDGGQSWQKFAGNPVIDSALAPGAVREPGGRWVVYVTRPDAPGIYRAVLEGEGDGDDGDGFVVDEAPVLVPRPSVPDAFDQSSVSSPWVTVAISASGTIRYSMFFQGTSGRGENETAAVGFAGSFDGISWSRFATPDEAVVEPGGRSELGPAAVLGPGSGVLFFSELERGVQAIAAAFHP